MLCFSACCFTPFALKAQQTSVYGTVDLSVFSTDIGNGRIYGSDKIGFVAGGFYTFASDSRFKPGVDVRVVEQPANSGGTAVLGALRVSFVPHKNPLRPYLQIGGGVISATNNDNGFATSQRKTGGGLEIDFGLDIRVTRHIDLRLPDYGAAAGGTTGTAWLGSGLVYHFD